MQSITKFLGSNWAFLLILLLAFTLRSYGLNWDESQHLHPDERFLTMVTQAIRFPESKLDYFNTNTSTLNPHNVNFSFYVYGTFPLFFVKFFTENLGFTDYSQVTLLGRLISNLFDLGAITLIYLIGLRFSKKVALLSSFFYSISVLAIQLSHFYAVDTFLNTLMLGTVYFFIKYTESKRIIFLIWSAIFLGLAEASKITAVLLLPGLFLFYLSSIYKSRLLRFNFVILIFPIIAGATFRIFQPYMFDNRFFGFGLNQKVLNNLSELQNYARPDVFFPPSINWNNTTPFYPLKEMVIWGLGLPLGVLSIIAFVYVFFFLVKRIKTKTFDRNAAYLLLFLTILSTIFIYQSLQFGKPLRYFIPTLPYLTIFCGFLLTNLKLKKYLLLLILLLVIIWPMAFMAIYTRDHSRVIASKWIYQNIPQGVTLSVDHWDDGLPLSLPSHPANVYKYVEFPLFGEDIPLKWTLMADKLASVDYIVITSNRLYGSTTRNPQMYPITSKFYDLLFSGHLGFQKLAEFTSRPSLNLPFLKTCLDLPFSDYGKISGINQECDLDGLTFVDDYVDETSTVYDHPKVVIFKKEKPVDYLNLLGVSTK